MKPEINRDERPRYANARGFNPNIVQDPILLTKDELIDLEVLDVIKEMGGFIALQTDKGNRWYYVTDAELGEVLFLISSVHLKISLKDAIKGLARNIFYDGTSRLDDAGRPQVRVSVKSVGEHLWTLLREDGYRNPHQPPYQAIIYHEGELDVLEATRVVNDELLKLQRRRIKLYKLWSQAEKVHGDLVVRLPDNRSLSITMNDLCYAVGWIDGVQRAYRNEADLLDDLKLYL